MTLYHGTSTAKLPMITKKGLVPRGSAGADSASGNADVNFAWGEADDLIHSRTHSVYLIDSIEEATRFADLVAGADGSDTAVLTVKIPAKAKDNLYEDEAYLSFKNVTAYRYIGKIPPGWIVDVKTGLKPKRPMWVLQDGKFFDAKSGRKVTLNEVSA